MSKPAPTPPNLTPANRFRPIIEQAITAGVDLSQQELRLTHGDSAKLKRDPTVRDDEISFKNGTMEFIGVRVVQGAPTSGLAEASEVLVTPSPSEGKPSKAKAKKKTATKEPRKPRAVKAKAAAATEDSAPPPAEEG